MKGDGKSIKPILSTILGIIMALILASCSDNSNDSSDAARILDLENSTFGFTNGSAFGINQSVTLTITGFDESGLLPVAPFTLSTNPTASGMVTVIDIESSDVTFTECNFDVASSDFPAGEGPQAGSQIQAECSVTDLGNILQVQNRTTNETSTGDRM